MYFYNSDIKSTVPIVMKKTISFLKKYTFCFFLGLAYLCANAQQQPQYTQYMYNTLTINPAYTGSLEGIDALLQYRSQWVGIEGAPETQAFTIHSPFFKNRVGLGLSVINERIGPADEFYADANFSYHIPVGYKSTVSLGLKAGLHMLNTDWSRGRFYHQQDVLLNTNIHNRAKPAIGAGIYYYTDNWYLGASLPNLVKSNYYDDIQETMVSTRHHYYFMGGCVFRLSESILFKPAFLIKAVTGAPVIGDVSANFLLEQKLTLGASYRWDDSVSALAGFQISKSLFVGYSYDYSVTELNKYNNGSHEIILRFILLPKTSRIKSPRFF